MAIQSASINRGLIYQAQLNSAKNAYQANMERSLLEKKYWDEILEKLRKSGGGGGGGNDSRFDRVAVSMMMTNFLSNKSIQAMLRNINVEFSKLISGRGAPQHISTIFVNIQKIAATITNNLVNVLFSFVRRDAPPGRLYDGSQHLLSLIGALSFQLNKLKEILKEDLKELIKKIKQTILDFFKKIFCPQ